MSLMGRLAKFDSSLQRGLDNAFALVFGGKVVPAEIEEALKQEMDDNAFTASTASTANTASGHSALEAESEISYTQVPNVFHVGVATGDFASLQGENPRLPVDFADQLGRFCRNQGWAVAGPVVVVIAEESGLRSGQLRVSSFSTDQPQDDSGFEALASYTGKAGKQADADLEGFEEESVNSDNIAPSTEFIAVPNPAQQQTEVPESQVSEPVVTLLLQDGSSRTYVVKEGSNIIGRATDADFRLPDTGVSRQHAEITWNGQDAVLVDLQSTNGTTVNDTPIENWLLADGDVITIGHSHIEVRITTAPVGA